jgi:dihydrofolate synthase/folylpolyglutamate synthase
MPHPRPSELILERLTELHPKRIDLSLDRIERLLDRLGRPERKLPPVVHIAGTNGKGSTLAMLAAMLRAAGHRVHRYISPHLVDFNERILLDDRPIPEVQLAEVLSRCERANGAEPITFFEITTAAAFMAMAETPADIVLLETGLGGRLDATNVIERPRLTLISPISMDHEAQLGSTLTTIAGEKAGILKNGVPGIAGPQKPEVDDVLSARAAEIAAPLLLHGRDWHVRQAGAGLCVDNGGSTGRWPHPTLAGVFQVENAGLAIMAARALGEFAISDAAVEEGLIEARWPARLQRLTRGPLVGAAGQRSTVLLDGGHNPAAGEALARSLQQIADPRPLHLVVGMLANKDMLGFLRPLAPLVQTISAVPIGGEHAARAPDELAAAAAELGLPAETAQTPLAAVRRIAEVGTPALILICGSLYLAGEILAENS